ncbi:AAEL007867-PA, partial [Aedes aegypti]
GTTLFYWLNDIKPCLSNNWFNTWYVSETSRKSGRVHSLYNLLTIICSEIVPLRVALLYNLHPPQNIHTNAVNLCKTIFSSGVFTRVNFPAWDPRGSTLLRIPGALLPTGAIDRAVRLTSVNRIPYWGVASHQERNLSPARRCCCPTLDDRLASATLPVLDPAPLKDPLVQPQPSPLLPSRPSPHPRLLVTVPLPVK